MGLRFYKRIKILPWVTLNISKTGISFSFGRPGAKITLGRNKVRKTFGIPGTGISYTTTDSIKKIIDRLKLKK